MKLNFSIRVDLEKVIGDYELKEQILSELEKCKKILGSRFKVFFTYEKLKESDIKDFIKENSNSLIYLNSEITKRLIRCWFFIGDKRNNITCRYSCIGDDIINCIHKYRELVLHILERGNK